MNNELQFYNKHYILLDASNNIIEAWSDGPHPNKDISKAICINEQGGYQFRLSPNGEENPSLYTMDGISLYKYEDGEIISRTDAEIKHDRLPQEIKNKQTEIRNICHRTIVNGFNLNDQHFSLEETDQLNLTAAVNAIKEGATSFPYHSDGEICRLYTAEEINTIAQAATYHKLYHTTLCNHLLQQLNNVTEYYQLIAIDYSPEALSSELRQSFESIIASAANL